MNPLEYFQKIINLKEAEIDKMLFQNSKKKRWTFSRRTRPIKPVAFNKGTNFRILMGYRKCEAVAKW